MPRGLRQRIQRLEAIQPVPRPLPADGVALLQQHGITPDDWQASALRSTATRQLWVCSRQSGKSLTAAALAWQTALHRPGSLTLCVAPALRQSQELINTIRTLRPRGMSLQQLSALRLRLDNQSRIIALPGSTDSTIRGFSRVALLVIDEAARVADTLYHALRPMVAVSSGTIVALSTPWGPRGWFHAAWASVEAWERTLIPATACPRIPRSFLEEEQRVLPPAVYASEYLCSFESGGEHFFDLEAIEQAFVDNEAGWESAYATGL